MKKILTIAILSTLILLTLTNCRSKKKILEKTNEKIEQNLSFNQKIDSKVQDSSYKKQEIDKTINKNVNQNNGDIIIKGSTKTEEPFDFHNVVNGDTLSVISIKGNATFEIKNNWKKETEKIEEKSKNEDLNIVGQIARKAVSQQTINKVAREAKSLQNTVNSTGFQAPIYIILGVCAVIAVILFIIIKQFKKK